MPLPSLSFSKQPGGLGRPLPGEDHISGLMYYRPSLTARPAGFGTDAEKTVFSLAEAEALGITQASSDYGRLWYHVSEYFRVQPRGVLHLGIYDDPADFAAHDYAEVVTLQQFAQGKIRQLGVYLDGVNGVNTAILAALHARAVALYADHMPMVVLAAFDLHAVALAGLPDLRTSTAYYVSVVIAQDGAATGAAIYDADEVSPTALGAALGSMALAQVHESIGWPRKFRPSETELDVAAFGNGDLFSAMSSAAMDTLHDKGYIFLRKFVGLSGSYWNDAPTAIAASSDFAYQEANRTIDKAVRLAYAALIQEVNGPVLVDPETGQLSESYTEYLKGVSDTALAQMAQDGELSGFQTLINPEQNVLATSTIEVTIELVGIGVSRTLQVNIGLKPQLS